VRQSGGTFSGDIRLQVNAREVFKAEGVDTVAISFVWSVLHPGHEARAGQIVREMLPGVVLPPNMAIPGAAAMQAGDAAGLAGLIGLTGDTGFDAFVKDFTQVFDDEIQDPHTGEP
jgi:hypothetical protein